MVKAMLHDRLLIEVDAQAERTPGGIYVPQQSKGYEAKRTKSGKIVAVGPGRMLDSGVLLTPGVVVGDRVIFSVFSGQEVTIDGSEYLIMGYDDVQAILEPDTLNSA